MVNDSVREELETKIGVGVPRVEKRPVENAPISEPEAIVSESTPTINAAAASIAAAPKREIPRPTPPLKRDTNRLSGPKTSPTLVGFQAKNAVMPDWRLQLQNTVRQRKGAPVQRTDAVADNSQARLVTQGANALKAEIVEEPKPAPAVHENPKIAKALERIDQSRKTFLPETKKPATKPAAASAKTNYPFNVVSRNQSALPARTPDGKPAMSDPPRPKLVPTFKIDKKKFDTNKLPPLPEEPMMQKSVEAVPEPITAPAEIPAPSVPEISIHAKRAVTAELTLADGDEIEDLAPISMRFNAGLFDVIIGAFGSFALLSPIVIAGGNWFSLSGLAAFAAVWATVMFIYMTISIGMYGKTLGMRMFGLELIDAAENDYPTFHQAAVHSAVFLLTLPLLGLGFLPMVFNEEQRAAHDLAAGTIIVTEF
jgi:uncharacterized RDD family membrane protein YckC